MSKITMSKAHRDSFWNPQSGSRNAVIASNAIVSLNGGKNILKGCRITAAHKVRGIKWEGKVIKVRRVHPKHNVWLGTCI